MDEYSLALDPGKQAGNCGIYYGHNDETLKEGKGTKDMKRWTGGLAGLVIAAALVLGGCGTPAEPGSALPEETSSTAETSTMPATSATEPFEINNDVWYSEQAGVRGRLWLGMTEKEVYDVLTEHDIEIKFYDNLEYDEYGAGTQKPYYNYKAIETYGHQFFEFDENDRLVEITYLDQVHYTTEPVNEEFESEKGLKRRDTYDRMVELYGEPHKITNIDDGWCYVYAYRLEAGYVLFTFNTGQLLAISYSPYDSPLYASINMPTP